LVQISTWASVWFENEADITKLGWPVGVAQVHQPAFRQHDDALAVGELDLVDLRLDVMPLEVTQVGDLDLRIEVADVADDGAMLHRAHVVVREHVDVAGRGDEDVALRRGFLHGDDLVASIAACRAQIGSTSETMTRQPAWRSEAAEPLPTSPKPATIATLPDIITSVPRRMPSTRDSRQP
jgi:hypothetical protein